MSQYLHYAFRSIIREPGLALATVLTLTLGLGLNVGVFTVVDGILFHARVEKDPLSFAIVIVLLGTISILAMVKPSLRAAALDPARALRDD